MKLNNAIAIIVGDMLARPEDEFITMNLKTFSLREGLGEAFREAFYG